VLRRVAGKRDALCGDTKPLEGLVPPLLQPRLVGGVEFTGEPGRSSSGPVSANTCLSRRQEPPGAMRICSIFCQFPYPDPRGISETPAVAEIDERQPR